MGAPKREVPRQEDPVPAEEPTIQQSEEAAKEASEAENDASDAEIDPWNLIATSADADDKDGETEARDEELDVEQDCVADVEDWQKQWDDKLEKYFYYNVVSGEISWEVPEGHPDAMEVEAVELEAEAGDGNDMTEKEDRATETV